LFASETVGFTINGYAPNYATGYFQTTSVGSLDVDTNISETKRIRIGDCQDNPVYLRWRNSLGGFDYWLFGYRQVKNNDVDKFDTFNPVIQDIETEQRSELVITKEFVKTWVLGATLSMQQVTDIQELFTSPYVQWWNEDNEEWYVCKIKSGSYLESVTDELRQEIEFEITFPKEYNQ